MDPMTSSTAALVPSVRAAWDRPDDVAAHVRAHGPHDELLEPLLAAARSGALSVRGRVDVLAALEQARSMLEAVQLQVIADMGRLDPDGKDWAREDIAAALRISPVSAANRLALARDLTSRFPTTVKLVESGALSVMHARKLVELTARLDDEAADLVESLVLPKAEGQTVGEFGRSVQRAVLRVDTASAAERHEIARNDRRVTINPLADGMSELVWQLPAEQAMHVKTVVDARTANPHPGDPRTADQRRSDTLYALIANAADAANAANAADAADAADVAHAEDTAHAEDAATTASPEVRIVATGDVDARAGRAADAGAKVVSEPTARGMRATVLVTVPITVLSGDSDAPAELAGHGPIPAELARRIAADPTSTWRRLVTDPWGQLLDYGRNTYRPPADLTRHVIARDQTCCFPGCTRAAIRCELDHCRDWAHGGGTAPDNLYALCTRHHHLKHDAGWRYDELPNGDIEWASPTGHRYIRQRRSYPDDHYFPEPPRRRPPPPTPTEQLPAEQLPAEQLPAEQLPADAPPPF